MHIYVGQLTVSQEVHVECVKLLVHSMKAERSSGKAPLINLGLRCKRVTNLSLLLHYPLGRKLPLPIAVEAGGGGGGYKSMYRRFGEEENLLRQPRI